MKIILLLVSLIGLNILYSCDNGQSKTQHELTKPTGGNEAPHNQDSGSNEKANQSGFDFSTVDDLFDIDNPLLNEIDENAIQNDLELQSSIENSIVFHQNYFPRA